MMVPWWWLIVVFLVDRFLFLVQQIYFSPRFDRWLDEKIEKAKSRTQEVA